MVVNANYTIEQAGLVQQKWLDKKWLMLLAVSISANALFAYRANFEAGLSQPSRASRLLSINLMPALPMPSQSTPALVAATQAMANSRSSPALASRSALLPANIVTEDRGKSIRTLSAHRNIDGDGNTQSLDKPQRHTQQNKALTSGGNTARLTTDHHDGQGSNRESNRERNRESNRESNSNENLPATATSHAEQQNFSDHSTTVQVAKHTAGALSSEATIADAAVVTRAGLSNRDGNTNGNTNGNRDSTTAAQYLYRQAPRYPPRARTLGQQGTVVLHAKVLPSGFSQNLEVAVSSGHRLLDGAALAAVRKWQFVPAYAQGQPVAHWVSVPVRFTLQ